jgi:RNA processing factor Prp31
MFKYLNLKDLYEDQWKPFLKFGFDPNKKFEGNIVFIIKGTIIKLPIRNENQKLKSKIVSNENCFDKEVLLKIFQNLMKDSIKLLLYSKNITKYNIKICLNDEMILLQSIQIDRDKEIIHSLNILKEIEKKIKNFGNFIN